MEAVIVSLHFPLTFVRGSTSLSMSVPTQAIVSLDDCSTWSKDAPSGSWAAHASLLQFDSVAVQILPVLLKPSESQLGVTFYVCVS